MEQLYRPPESPFRVRREVLQLIPVEGCASLEEQVARLRTKHRLHALLSEAREERTVEGCS